MYTHLTMDDRLVISRLRKKDFSRKSIAQIVGVHHTTISREISRSSEGDVYVASVAKIKAKERRCVAKYSSRKIENDTELEKRVKDCFVLRYSPEQISGYLSRENTSLSHVTIYRYLYRSFPRGKVYLRRQGKKRRLYGTKRAKQDIQKAKKVRIDCRPQHIEQREKCGDFEGDTVTLGGRKQRLHTLVDRKSGYLLMNKVVSDARGVADHIREQTLNFSRKHHINSITYDNGTEFSLHKVIEKQTGAKVFFAYPYHSWERGTNENTNGLVRQYFPKGMHGDKVSISSVKKVQYLLNHRPRKRLGYLTPHEVFVLKKEPVHFKV